MAAQGARVQCGSAAVVAGVAGPTEGEQLW